jgi:uncharacterized protein YjbJ (UPF0337 family)
LGWFVGTSLVAAAQSGESSMESRAGTALAALTASQSNAGVTMDKDRVEGAGNTIKGKAKTAAGKALGDEKLKNEGRADQVKGKVQNTVGGIKDKLDEESEKP